jgi:hypothetical protein
MSEITRRHMLAAAAVPPFALAQSPTQASDVRGASAPPHRRMLASRWDTPALLKALQPRAQWKPYPTSADREPWTALPATIREPIVTAAAARLGTPYPPLPATLFLEYARDGNRSRYEAVKTARQNHLREAVIAECFEGQGRFLDDIANGVWTLCEETYWGYPAHVGVQKRGNGLPDVSEPTVDLFAGEAGALLAWTDYLLGPQLDRVSPLIRERIRVEIERRILAVYRDRSDFWWMGLDPQTANRPMNNWNPWINSNVLACALLIEGNVERRAATVHKILRSLDRFLDSYHDDGGCDEGPSYWGHAGGSLFDNLDLLHSASRGAIDFYSTPLIREIGAYIYRAHIADSWYVNFADANARIQIYGDLVYRYGRAVNDRRMQQLGAAAARKAAFKVDTLGRTLPELFNMAELRNAPAGEPLLRDAWLPGLQFAAARQTEGSNEGLYFAALGGHNAESHNHNDVGNFIVYYNGQPFLIDAGVGVYTAQTFSSRRYEIWTMQSGYHNLPTVNGVQQGAGRNFAAHNAKFQTSDDAAEFTVDIARAYPPEAKLTSWNRSVRLDRRARAIHVTDDYAVTGGNPRIDMSLLFARPVANRDGLLLAGSGRIAIEGPVKPRVTIEEIDTSDNRMRANWGDRIYRAVLSWDSAPQRGRLRFVISA